MQYRNTHPSGFALEICASILHTNLGSWLHVHTDMFITGNIGLSRQYDHRWITQYSALFCVLNGNGQVVTWRLTLGVSFSDVQDTLLLLKHRLFANGKQVKEFFIDNCCSWRNCLQSVFGKHLKVYLDLFHAVKRISDKIPKRHKLRSECMNHLRMVFRDPVDQGPERKIDTPDPHVLAQQMNENGRICTMMVHQY